jgi:Zn-dependent protease
MSRRAKLVRLTTLPAYIPLRVSPRPAIASGAVIAASVILAPLAHAAGATLGSQMQTASQDLTTGGGFILELVGYIVGVAAMLAGGFTIWQHTKNPNGQHRMSYGIISVLAGGFFLALSTMAQFSSNTVSGANATNTGTSQQLQIQ